jgi:hypothetical protein
MITNTAAAAAGGGDETGEKCLKLIAKPVQEYENKNLSEMVHIHVVSGGSSGRRRL